jgi:hypothetical protein
MKSMTLRLEDSQAALLEAVAGVDDISMQEAIRTAIDKHIEDRRRDIAFKKRLKSSMKRNQDILEKLAQ